MLGLCLGGLAIALFTGLMGLGVAALLNEGVRAIIALASLAAFATVELSGRGDRLPQARRLVPQTILRASSVSGPLQFGFEMGTGVRTFMPSSLPLALAALVVFRADSLLLAAAAGIGFGFGRALVRPARLADPLEWDSRLTANRRAFSSVLTAGFMVSAGSLIF